MEKAAIGLIGLAVMGENLVMNMENHGFKVAVYNRTTEKVDKFINGRAKGKILTHGLFIGEGRKCLTEAVKLAQEKNIDFVEHGIKKCVVYLDPSEFKTTWLGNKAVYRTRMAIVDGGELIILAPGVKGFGEDKIVDGLIRKYGYRGREYVLEKFRAEENKDLRENMGATAHLIHGSSDGRFKITYAVQKDFMPEIEGVGFAAADIDGMQKIYDPQKLSYGYNDVAVKKSTTFQTRHWGYG